MFPFTKITIQNKKKENSSFIFDQTRVQGGYAAAMEN
jgi:hypothetical protein